MGRGKRGVYDMETQQVIVALILGLLVLAVIGFAVFSKIYEADKDSENFFNQTIKDNLGAKLKISQNHGNIYISLDQILLNQNLNDKIPV